MDNEIYSKLLQNYNVSRETFLQLSEYVELLQKWQRKINLISNNTANDIWRRHIEDSLQLSTHVSRETSGIIDIGSGGGLPGIPLAICTKLPVLMIESDKKKCSFLEEVTRNLVLTNIKVYCSRIESANIYHGSNKYTITARALSSLVHLFQLTTTLISNNNIKVDKLILPKGKTAAKEIDEAKLSWNFDFERFDSATDNNASILAITNLRRK